MKKMVRLSIALCTGLAIFVSIREANAMLVKAEDPCLARLEKLKRADYITIENWLNEPKSLVSNATFRQVVTATESITGLKEKRIEGVVKCLNKAITKKKPAYFGWCAC